MEGTFRRSWFGVRRRKKKEEGGGKIEMEPKSPNTVINRAICSGRDRSVHGS